MKQIRQQSYRAFNRILSSLWILSSDALIIQITSEQQIRQNAAISKLRGYIRIND